MKQISSMVGYGSSTLLHGEQDQSGAEERRAPWLSEGWGI